MYTTLDMLYVHVHMHYDTLVIYQLEFQISIDNDGLCKLEKVGYMHIYSSKYMHIHANPFYYTGRSGSEGKVQR